MILNNFACCSQHVVGRTPEECLDIIWGASVEKKNRIKYYKTLPTLEDFLASDVEIDKDKMCDVMHMLIQGANGKGVPLATMVAKRAIEQNKFYKRYNNWLDAKLKDYALVGALGGATLGHYCLDSFLCPGVLGAISGVLLVISSECNNIEFRKCAYSGALDDATFFQENGADCLAGVFGEERVDLVRGLRKLGLESTRYIVVKVDSEA